jgi:hypothetical protein
VIGSVGKIEKFKGRLRRPARPQAATPIAAPNSRGFRRDTARGLPSASAIAVRLPTLKSFGPFFAYVGSRPSWWHLMMRADTSRDFERGNAECRGVPLMAPFSATGRGGILSLTEKQHRQKRFLLQLVAGLEPSDSLSGI